MRTLSFLALFATTSALAQTPAPTFNVEEATIADIHAAMKAGRLSCRSLVEQYLRRIEVYDRNGPAINAIVAVNPAALRVADSLDRRYRAWRSMLELSRGVSDGLEVGLHIPFVIDRDGKPYAAGLRPRLRWIPVRPAQDEAGAFLGLNLEYSDIKREFERPARHIEWRPILGWRGPEWTIAANPALTTWLSDTPRPKPEFSFNAMVKRQVSGHTRVGLEYYSAYGPVDAFLPPAQRDQLLFLAADFVVAGYVVNAGIGHALTSHADHTVLKLQVTLP